MMPDLNKKMQYGDKKITERNWKIKENKTAVLLF